MLCTDCDFHCVHWEEMKDHYKQKHPQVNPTSLFTREARKK